MTDDKCYFSKLARNRQILWKRELDTFSFIQYLICRKKIVFKCIAYIKKLKVTGNINYPNINKLEMFSVRNIFVARNPKLKPWLIAMSFFPNMDGRKRVFKLEIF